tara:strand:- start:312 stop:539 length:228 start_codon:yes stop_codon:yes gene_type:complete
MSIIGPQEDRLGRMDVACLRCMASLDHGYLYTTGFVLFRWLTVGSNESSVCDLVGEKIDHFDGRTLNPGHAIEDA